MPFYKTSTKHVDRILLGAVHKLHKAERGKRGSRTSYISLRVRGREREGELPDGCHT